MTTAKINAPPSKDNYTRDDELDRTQAGASAEGFGTRGIHCWPEGKGTAPRSPTPSIREAQQLDV
jgi:hypothetical protein